MTTRLKEYLITSSTAGDRCAAVWDPETGNLLNQYKHGSNIPLKTLQILGDSYLIAADLAKPRLQLWLLNSQTPVINIRLSTPGKVSALACTSDGFFAVAGINEKLYVWQTCTGQLIKILCGHYQTVTCISFSRNNSCFASAADDNLLLVWSLSRSLINLPSGELRKIDCSKPLHTFSDHSQPVKDICFGSFDTRAILCSVSLDKTLKIYEANTGTLLRNIIFGEPVTAVRMDALENNVFVGCIAGSIKRIDLRNLPTSADHHYNSENSQNSFQRHQTSVVTLSVSSDCLQLVSGDSNGNVCIWDIATGALARTITLKGSVSTACFGRAFANYQASKFRPSLKVSPLRLSEESKNEKSIIEIFCEDESEAIIKKCEELLHEEMRLDEMSNTKSEELEEKLRQSKSENEKLKEINQTLYKMLMENQLPTSSKPTTSSK